VAVKKSDISLGDLPAGEHVAEFAVCAVVFGDEDETAGQLVEAMDDARAEIAADVGEFIQVEEQGVNESAAIARLVGGTGSCVDHHTGGLIYDGDVFVFVEDVEGNVFGGGMEGSGSGRAFNLNGFAAVEFLLGLCQIAVDADLTGFDEELDAGSGDVGEGLGEVLVEAEIRGGGVGGEGMEAIFCFVFEFEDGDWRWCGFFDASGGAVFGFYGAAALALGEHVLRRHG
jgi:hypothetical protein